MYMYMCRGVKIVEAISILANSLNILKSQVLQRFADVILQRVDFKPLTIVCDGVYPTSTLLVVGSMLWATTNIR